MEDDSIVVKSVIGSLALVAFLASVTIGIIIGFILNAVLLVGLLSAAAGVGLAFAIFAFSTIVSKHTIES